MEAQCERESAEVKDNEQSQKDRGKKQKSLKTAPVCPKHAIFATETSRQKVARSSRQNTQGQKFENFF